MENQKVLESFKNALTEFETAVAELNRPKRDVVMVATCDLIKKAVGDFLHAFLLVHDKPGDPTDLTALYNECQSINPAFASIHMDVIMCLDEESTTSCQRCLESGWINKCEDVMVETKELVMRLLHERQAQRVKLHAKI